MRRLLPDYDADVTVAASYTDARRGRVDGRPWVLVNMISSLDGAVAIGQRSGGLGGRGDRDVFGVLRSLADVIIVGAGTARAERYGPPQRSGQRIGVVTRGAHLDWQSPLFASGAGFVITTTAAPDVPVDAVRAGHDAVDLRLALEQLHSSVSIVLCEGGPSLNGDLLAADLIDEWCLTLSPILVSGAAGRAAISAVEHATDFRLAHVLTDEDQYLYVRALRTGRVET
jgi:riboflavin biosynthesis pyrimidine reductase